MYKPRQTPDKMEERTTLYIFEIQINDVILQIIEVCTKRMLTTLVEERKASAGTNRRDDYDGRKEGQSSRRRR